MEDRHEIIINQLSELPPSTNDIGDILPENKEQWRDLIHLTGVECNQTDNIIKPLQNELKKRTNHMLNVIKVLNNKQPDALLDDIILSIDKKNKQKEEKEEKKENNNNNNKDE